MSMAVTLTITRGGLKGQQVVFYEPAHCLIGRARDCTIQLQREPGRLDISRHHCLVEIEPAGPWVRDLGSLNGTFVNGRMIGKRAPHDQAEYIPSEEAPPHPLRSGDQIQVGDVVFRVGIREVAPLEQTVAVG